MNDNPVKQEVQNFDKRCLKKTTTQEKSFLPTQDGKPNWNPSFSIYMFPMFQHTRAMFTYMLIAIRKQTTDCKSRYVIYIALGQNERKWWKWMFVLASPVA